MSADNNITEGKAELQLRGKMLFDQLKHGDNDAWEQFLKQYGPRLRANIRRSLGKRGMPMDRADDIEQDVWQFVRKRIDIFEYQSDAKTHHWLANIAFNHVRTLRHSERRGNLVSLDEIAAAEDNNTASVDHFFYRNQLYAESAEASLSRMQLQKELTPILELALRELSARDREIVVRRLILKEHPPEIAERFSLKTVNVYQIVSRAKKSMRGYLKARGFFQQTPGSADSEE